MIRIEINKDIGNGPFSTSYMLYTKEFIDNIINETNNADIKFIGNLLKESSEYIKCFPNANVLKLCGFYTYDNHGYRECFELVNLFEALVENYNGNSVLSNVCIAISQAYSSAYNEELNLCIKDISNFVSKYSRIAQEIEPLIIEKIKEIVSNNLFESVNNIEPDYY